MFFMQKSGLRTRVRRNDDGVVRLGVAVPRSALESNRHWTALPAAPRLNGTLEEHCDVVFDHIVHLALQIAHNAEYPHLIFPIARRRKHAWFSIRR